MDLGGRKVLITGASGGIGHATAAALATEGAVLAVSGRRVDALESLAESIAAAGGTRPFILPADLSERGAAARLGMKALETLGTVDVLINSAGYFETGSQWNSGDSKGARELFEINYWSPMALTRTLLPGMRARGTGALVNLSSLATVTPPPFIGHYPSAKAALAIATDALRGELQASGVQVVLLFLGSVDTPMHTKASRPYGSVLKWMPLGDPATVARLIVKALRRGHKTIVYPRSVAAVRFLPTISAWVSGRFLVPLLLRAMDRPVSDCN